MNLRYCSFAGTHGENVSQSGVQFDNEEVCQKMFSLVSKAAEIVKTNEPQTYSWVIYSARMAYGMDMADPKSLKSFICDITGTSFTELCI